MASIYDPVLSQLLPMEFPQVALTSVFMRATVWGKGGVMTYARDVITVAQACACQSLV
jgi:hypothetical protein